MTAGAARYVRSLFALTGLLVLAITACNLVVDPYGIYRLVEAEGFNTFKSRAAQRGFLFKLHLLEHLRPRMVIFGNSRAEVGFDPRHPLLVRQGLAANLALPGTGVDTPVQFLRHAIANAPPRLAIVGLDFVDARTNADPESARLQYEQLPGLLSAPVLDRRARVMSHVDALLSIDAFYDAVLTLADNRRPDAPGLDALGFNPMRDYAARASMGGYHDLFLQRDRENARSYARGPKEVFVRGSRTSPYFHAVRDLVASCRNAGIELHLVIYPYHAHILELFHLTGLWRPFEDWKRGLVEVLHEDAATGGSGQALSLWDFSGYSEYASEPVPPPGDLREVRWYWEAGHFRKELGDVMLGIMLDRSNAPHGDFGADLMRVDLEPHLARITAGRTAYLEKRPDEAAQLARMVRGLRSRR